MAKILIVFILGYTGSLAATVLVDVSWGVFLYEVQYFLNPVIRWWYSYLPDLRYSMIISLFILFSYIIHMKKYSSNRVGDCPQFKWLLLMMVMMLVVWSYAVWPDKHYGFMVNHFKLMMFLVLAYKVVDTPTKFERMIWAYLIGNFYVGWVAHSTGRTGFGRLEGIGMADSVEANDMGAVLITSIPVLLFYILNGRRWQKVASLLFMAFIMDGIVLLNSRGAFLGLTVSCGYMTLCMIFSKHSSLIQRVKMVVMMMMGACLFVYMTDQIFWERMLTLKEVGSGGGGASRTYFWKKTFDLVSMHPFGVGVWGYQYLSPTFIPPEMLTKGMRAVHSTYFQVFAEYGYPGVPMFLGLIMSNFLYTKRIKRFFAEKGDVYLYQKTIAIEAGLIAFLVASMFIDRLYAEMLYWFMLFIGCFGNIFMLKNGMVDLPGTPNMHGRVWR